MASDLEKWRSGDPPSTVAAAAASSSSSAGAAASSNLASSASGASILFATDEWFATAERLLDPAPPTFVPDLYCPQGKVMDGWETRRKRTPGHDWCVIKLDGGGGARGGEGGGGGGGGGPFAIERVELDTAHFTGNQTPRVSIEAMRATRERGDGGDEDDDDCLYAWMPGAVSRLARGPDGPGVRGTGKSPRAIERALEACRAVARRTTGNPGGEWIELLPRVGLRPGYEESRHHAFDVVDAAREALERLGGCTHLRLNYYPDGGVARLRVYGCPVACMKAAVWRGTGRVERGEANGLGTGPRIHPHSSPNPPPSALPHPHPELSSSSCGGIGLVCSNQHYGVPPNLVQPSLGMDMGDGWETARHPDRPAVVTRDPATGLQDTHLSDWCVLKLGMGGAWDGEGIGRIIVDTRHFKGNFPESVRIDGCRVDPAAVSDDEVCAAAGAGDDGGSRGEGGGDDAEWFPLLPRTRLTADAEHEFLRDGLASGRKGVTHVRVRIYPDGGLSRVRIYGVPADTGETAVPRSHL
ncbi:hypothetical protein ACHAWF_012423 [Thalassiosira exigua]